LRSAQPNVERQTSVSPETAAPAMERETAKPGQRPSSHHAPVPAAPRAAPAPAKWSWQPSQDPLPARSQLPEAGSVSEPAALPLPAVAALMSRFGVGLKSAGAGEEWELLIGGRWLNKVGVAVLVIGMALLLNFALDYMGPGGKVMLGAGVALAM